MKQYTIGAVFSPDFLDVLLIKKEKPAWQKGYYNFPGGSVEEGEDWADCVSREFKEEADLDIPSIEWKFIGMIDSDLGYQVAFLAAVWDEKRHGEPKSLTTEEINWLEVDNLPDNCISNLYWLVPFAVNIFGQGNHDSLSFGTFKYVQNP